jgi:AcrR family transcriptional regulator
MVRIRGYNVVMATEMTTLDPPSAEVCSERADAARNRVKVVKAAERLIAERGIDNISMDEIAAEAGVGKGTLFRRFGDRAGLARALVQARAAEFLDSLGRGPAPLGPEAPPRERLIAFGEGALDQLECQGQLALEAERGSSSCDHYRSDLYAFYRAHVVSLLEDAELDLHAGYCADVLLSALSAEFYSRQRDIGQRSLEELKTNWRGLVERLLPA